MPQTACRGLRLVAENVAVAYAMPNGGKLTALEIDRLELSPGSHTAISGPSGSGKTTLLHVLSGIEAPGTGRVMWGEVDLFALGEAARDRWRRSMVGLVFQQFHLFASLSPLENVLLPIRFGSRRVATAMAQARGLLDRVGVRAGGETARLSRGEMQRVAIARALVSTPAILLADEPTASLDADAASLVAELLLSVCRDDGVTLVLTTHDAGLAARCAPVIQMKAGRLGGASSATVTAG